MAATETSPAESRRQVPGWEAFLSLGLMVLIGSTTAIAAKVIVAELPVALMALARFGGAGVCLLAYVWVTDRPALVRLVRTDLGRLLAAGALFVPINQSFFLGGTKLAPASHVALIYAACPLVVLALAVLSGQERLAPGRLVGILVSVAGVVVIGLGNLWQHGGQASGLKVLAGDLLLVGAVVSWGAYLTVSKSLVSRHKALPALAATLVAGCLLEVPLAAVAVGEWPSLGEVSPTAWACLAFLTFGVTIFGQAFQNLAMSRFDASVVATVNNASPLLTVAWAVWLLGETVTPALLVGGALTLGGIFGLGTTVRPASSAKAIEPEPREGAGITARVA